MSAFEVAVVGANAIVRSGIWKPPTPRGLLRLARVARGALDNPATLLAVAAARWPGRAAMIDDGGPITYAALQRDTEALAHSLRTDHNVGPGDAVGVLCRNGRGFLVSMFGAAMVGADVVLLNNDFNPPALAAALHSHRIWKVLCDSEFVEKVREADASVAVLHPAAPHSWVTARPVVAPAGKLVILTSGTTGAPKGVPRTPAVGQVLGVAATVIGRTGLRTGCRIAVAVPFFHAFGFAMLLLAFALGATVLTRRRFDAEAALAQAALHRTDALAVVPIMLARILDLPEAVRARNPVGQLQAVISGGAALEPALALRFMDAYGDILYNGYGSSEVGIGSFATPADLRRAPGTVGRPVAGSPVQILDDQDRPVATGVVGRVFVGGDLAFDGYTGGAGKPVVAGKTGTGDMGYLDERGCLFIVGREDDMIVSGGENVYPQAVENALAEHPDLAETAVVGVADAEYGQRLVAFVLPHAGRELVAAELRDFLRSRVSRFEQPRDIYLVTEIPRTSTGKIDRKVLRHKTEAVD